MHVQQNRFLIWEESPAIRKRIQDYIQEIQPNGQVVILNSLLQIMMEEPHKNWGIILQMSRVTASQRSIIGRKILRDGGTIFALYQNQFQKMVAEDMGAQFLIKRDMEHIPVFIGHLRSFIHQFLSKSTVLSHIDVQQEHSNISPSIPFVGTPIQVSKPDIGYPNNILVAIGTSTGGVEALSHILSKCTKSSPPILISIHMPDSFIVRFVQQLQVHTEMNVDVAKEGESLDTGMVRISPAGRSFLGVYRHNRKIYTTLNIVSYISSLWAERDYERYNPSIDYMFDCLACICPKQTVGVILTGMGSDGVLGLFHLRNNGGYTLCQDQESSVVYGMPKRAWEEGAAMKEASLENMIKEINLGVSVLQEQYELQHRLS